MDVKAILDARRGLPGRSLVMKAEVAEDQVNPWALSALSKGIRQIGKWIDLAWGAATLSRKAYREIAQNVYMTAPALLIAFISQILQTLNLQEQVDVVNILVRYGLWLLGILVLWIAAVVLRGKADYSTTLRVAGFAQTGHVLEVLGFVPIVGPMARILGLVLALVGVWLGTATAHELKGWRTILLPVIYVVAVVISAYFILAVIEGTGLAVDGLLYNLGVQSGP